MKQMRYLGSNRTKEYAAGGKCMETKKYILYGHGGSYNHGVEAITKCTIKLIKEVNPNSRIILSTHFPEQDKEFLIPANVFLERNLEGETNYEVYKSTYDEISANSVLIHVGGDNYCYNNWERYAQIHEASIQNGAKSFLWGCSIDEDRLSEELINVLKSHSLILAREPLTYNALISRGLTNVCKVSDIAFGLEPEEVALPTENYVVVNISPLVCRKNPKAEEAVDRLIDFILKSTDFSVVLVPHVMAKVDNDFEQLSKYREKDLERVHLVSDKYSAAQYKYIISHARLCVAARTHVTIAAYSSCVPTLAIGYSTKARGIGKDLKLEEYVIDVEDEDFEELLISNFCKLKENEVNIRAILEESMPCYKQNTCNEQIKKLLMGE